MMTKESWAGPLLGLGMEGGGRELGQIRPRTEKRVFSFKVFSILLSKQNSYFDLSENSN
jgi:hypothetical protein